MKLVFATNNKHKLSEVQDLLTSSMQILTLKEIKCFEDIEETEDTHIFTENRAKARGELINILFHYVAPKYDLTFFYKNPEFASELLQTKK